MQDYYFNNTKLSEATIKKTDIHFADICQKCIEYVLNGGFVNDKKKYIKDNLKHKKDYLNGLNRNSSTYLQRAYFIQTGENIALLP